jgi:hypothetical protein
MEIYAVDGNIDACNNALNRLVDVQRLNKEAEHTPVAITAARTPKIVEKSLLKIASIRKNPILA